MSGFSLKDQLFNSGKVHYLAGLFETADKSFDANAFETDVMARLPELELKARIAWIADCLGRALPGALPDIGPTILAALPAPLDPTRTDDDFGDFIFAPIGELIVAKGRDDHPNLVLDLLEQTTQRFSMEWSVRPMLNTWPELTMARMAQWARSENYHVRRLASEGSRPRLPWGEGVSLPLGATIGVLDALHGDPTRYVTRSVANHLNDISKTEPDLVLDVLSRWANGERQDPKELRWMTGHALRGLIKAGHPKAMKMLGFDPDAAVEVSLEIPDQVRIDDALSLSIDLTSDQDLPVLVDFVLHFVRPNGKVSAKVFKLKQARLRAGQTTTLTKAHKLRGNATTFTLVPGRHQVDVQVNGVLRDSACFDLLPPR